MLNTELIKMVLNTKLDEIAAGKAPEGFVIVEQNAGLVVLTPENGAPFGLDCETFKIVITHKRVKIKIVYGTD